MVAEAWDREDDGREPWVPEGLAFKVGDRVRVLPRPECLYCVGSEDEDGCTGFVRERETFRDDDEWGPMARAHPYWVEFNEPLPDGCRSPFAASELIPLPADEDAR